AMGYEGAGARGARFTGRLPLGQLKLTPGVESFPGFPHGSRRPELMMAMREQAVNLAGTSIVTEDIVSMDLSRRPFVLKDSAGRTLESHSLVIATGARANYLGLESEEKFKNFGVSACAVCDGAL